MDASGIILGAGLAVVGGVVGGVVMEWVKVQLAQRRAKGFFLTLLGIELPLIIATLDELADDYGKVGYFPLGTAGRLQVQRQGYDRNQNGLVLLAPTLRTEVIAFYQRLAAVAQDLTGVEHLLLQKPDAKDFVTQTRAELVGRVRDVAGRGRALLQQLTPR
jgi:hypothetical protein